MRNFRNTVKTIAIIMISLHLASCNEKEELISTTPNFNIEKYYSEIVEINDLGAFSVQHVEISLENDSKSPDGLYVNGEAFLDDGEGFDKVKNDGIFTSANKNKLETNLNDISIGNKKYHYLKSSESNNSLRMMEEPCRIRIYRPGEDGPCGVCPDDSILGGRTWFCICVSNCLPDF